MNNTKVAMVTMQILGNQFIFSVPFHSHMVDGDKHLFTYDEVTSFYVAPLHVHICAEAVQ